MRLRPLALSATIFLVLLAITWWAVGDRNSVETPPFFTLKKQSPDTLTIAFGGDTTVVVPGGESGWRLIRPVRYPADGLVIDALAKRLTPLVVDQRFPLLPEKMDTYGMRFPRAMIRAAYVEGHRPDTLLVGGFGLGGEWDYVRPGSAPEVALLPAAEVRAYFLKGPLDIRDTRLMPFHESRAAELTLRGPGGDTRLLARKNPEGAWNLLQPYPGPVNPRKIREYLASVAHMHIREFLREGDGPPGPFGLETPTVIALVKTLEGEELGVRLGSRIPGTDSYYAQTLARPHILAVSEKYVPVLGINPNYFREEAPFSFGMAGVDTVRVSTPRGSWTVPTRGSVDSLRAAQDVLRNWIGLRAEDFREAGARERAEWGLEPPAGTLTWLGAGDTLAVVEVGRTAEGFLPLRVVRGRNPRSREILLVPGPTAVPLWTFLARGAGRGS